MNLSPFPVWDFKEKQLIDGSVFKCPSICKKRRKNCSNYYQKIIEQKGFHIAPCGLSTYSLGHGKKIIFSGIRVEKKYNIKKTKSYKSDFLPTLPQELITNFIKNHIEKTEQVEIDTKLINSTLHEIRKFNAEIKKISEEILILDEIDKNSLPKRIKTIFAASSLMSIRLNVFDFEENPKVITSTPPYPLSLYKKFDKANHILEVYAKNKRINIKITGNSYKIIEAYQIIDFLPFVILENAIKYSPNNQDITIEFTENDTGIGITVTSIGPTITDEEIDDVFNKGKRGNLAEKIENTGGGYGLYFAKIVCDLHNIGIKVVRGQYRFTLGGISYSDFIVCLKHQTQEQNITMRFT